MIKACSQQGPYIADMQPGIINTHVVQTVSGFSWEAASYEDRQQIVKLFPVNRQHVMVASSHLPPEDKVSLR